LVNSLSEIENLQIKVFYLDRNIDPRIKILVSAEQLDRHHFCFNEYDIIHTTGIRPDLFAFRNRRKIKCNISTIHNFVFDDLAFNYNRLISWIFGNIWLIVWKKADKLVCVSEVLKNYYEKWFPDIKLDVIHNGIAETDDSFVPETDVIEVIKNYKSKGLKVLGTAGILTKRKGIDQLLPLLAVTKDYALIIIGNGKELSNLKRMATNLDILDRCMFCGFRSNAANYFKYFDLFVMPSRSEGFGLALIEAVQQKVPVVCSDLPVFNELLNSDEATFFKLEDIYSLTQALRTSIKLGTTKAELAYNKYIAKFTNQLMALKYFELYHTFCPEL
jgi:L-malate glycosyltransferase